MSNNRVASEASDGPAPHCVKIGTYYPHAPYGIAIIVDDKTGFLIDPDCDGTGGKSKHNEKDVALAPPAETSPDYSFVRADLRHAGADVCFTWGRVGPDAVVGTLVSSMAVTLDLRLGRSWPRFYSVYGAGETGVTGYGICPDGEYVPFRMEFNPTPKAIRAVWTGDAAVTLALEPGVPVAFAAGIGRLPKIDSVGDTLAEAERKYRSGRTRAEGPWGDFSGAIAENMNSSRLYSSDNAMTVHVVGRGWWIYHQHPINCNPDLGPYFCWDSFFNGLLACLEDPDGARDTVRAVLSLQTPEGIIGNFSHWLYDYQYVSVDRSQPPVAAMCVWNMHQRRPDTAFLEEVYPRIVKWHDWWPKHRDGNKNGLLEWGSEKKEFWAALLETGWDDTVHFDGAKMVGSTMNADAVDLSALWSADAEYLALIADAIGKKADAERFREEHRKTNRLINDLLWNEELGVYCSRLWNDAGKPGAFLTRLTPMNFYPLICGAPDGSRAERTLHLLYREDRFWGRWPLPTVAYNDPVWPNQHYWRGHVWPPANYLVWRGLLRYADSLHCAEFARKSVEIFMRSWDEQRVCGENYRSDNGAWANHPHYTWGALLPMIGIEALTDVDRDFRPVPRKINGITEHLVLRNIPFGGTLYRIEARDGVVRVLEEA